MAMSLGGRPAPVPMAKITMPQPGWPKRMWPMVFLLSRLRASEL